MKLNRHMKKVTIIPHCRTLKSIGKSQMTLILILPDALFVLLCHYSA